MAETPDEQSKSRAEADHDPLVDLVASAASSPEHPVWQDPRFLEWLEQHGNTRGGNAEQTESMARDLQARVFCRRYGIQRLNGPAPIPAGDYIAIDVEPETAAFAPLFHAGDTLLVSYTIEEGAEGPAPPRAYAVNRDGALAVVDTIEEGLLGVIVLVWCPHTPRE